MVKKLQAKFILISMLSIMFVTGSIFGLIILTDYIRMDVSVNNLLDLIISNNGSIPDFGTNNMNNKEFNRETRFATRYFTITLDDGVIENFDLSHIASVSENEAMEMLDEALSSNEESDYLDDFKYKISKNNNKTLVVFLDYSTQKQSFDSAKNQAVIIITVGLIIVFVVVSSLSKIVLKPMIENIEGQKQFITNAGHDLKTPVAVIRANVDVLEMSLGEEHNEWIDSIKHQTKRLDTLIKSLLDLANMEEGRKKLEYSTFSLTELINDEVNDFKALAKDRTISFDNSQDIQMRADQNNIKQLISILLDNAIKYTPEDGLIEIAIKKQGKTTKIRVSNTCDNYDSIDAGKLFDRFYREDKSRTHEGYGIGLSIAKTIVELHKGKIYADVNMKKKMINFNVTI